MKQCVRWWNLFVMTLSAGSTLGSAGAGWAGDDVHAELWALQKSLLTPLVIWMATVPGLGWMPKGTKAGQSAITELLKSTLLRLMNNAATTWSQDSASASARTWRAILGKMKNMVPCLSHILFPQVLCIENAVWAGTSTNSSFITEKFFAHPCFVLCSLMLPPAGQIRKIRACITVWSSRSFHTIYPFRLCLDSYSPLCLWKRQYLSKRRCFLLWKSNSSLIPFPLARTTNIIK